MESGYYCAITWFFVGLLLLVVSVLLGVVSGDSDELLLSSFGVYTLALILITACGYCYMHTNLKNEKFKNFNNNIDFLYNNTNIQQDKLRNVNIYYMIEATNENRGKLSMVKGSKIPAVGLDTNQVYSDKINAL